MPCTNHRPAQTTSSRRFKVMHMTFPNQMQLIVGHCNGQASRTPLRSSHHSRNGKSLMINSLLLVLFEILSHSYVKMSYASWHKNSSDCELPQMRGLRVLLP